MSDTVLDTLVSKVEKAFLTGILYFMVTLTYLLSSSCNTEALPEGLCSCPIHLHELESMPRLI